RVARAPPLRDLCDLAWPCLIERRSARSVRLRRLFVSRFVVHLEPIEQRRRERIEPVRLQLFYKPIAFFRIVIRIRSLDLIAPGLHFLWRLFLAVAIEPGRHFFLARAFLDLRLEVVALHPLETEEHVIERTIEMVFADISSQKSAALVVGARQNCITTDPFPRTAGRFLREIFALYILVHDRT